MSTRFERYDDWAWLYDKTMGPEYCNEQLRMLRRVLLPMMPKNGEVLDLCCGTGQLIQPLINAGLKVTGLDSSEQMLAFAKQNAPAAEYVLEDARVYRDTERFHGAISTSASLNHVPTIEDLSLVFMNVYASLKPGGHFVFDINHHDQLTRWWRGRPVEGEVTPEYAWMLTPRYDAEKQSGSFRVAMHRPPSDKRQRWSLTQAAKNVAYRVLSRDRFIGTRLALLQRFTSYEPQWDHREVDFPVVGHDLDEVRSALRSAGFEEVRVETINGGVVDQDHSAHFACTKAEQ